MALRSHALGGSAQVGAARGLFALLSAVAVAACGASPSPPVPAPPPPARTSTSGQGAIVATLAPAPDTSGGARSVRLHFELDGHPFPVPLVRGTVGGQPTWMLVDTGSTGHTVAGWLARQAHLVTRGDASVGVDHAGRSILTSRLEHADLRIDGWGATPDGPVLVTEIPEAIERLGIGAFISPQHLAKMGETLVLDLAREEMHLVSSERGRGELGGGEGASLFGSPPRVCSDGDAMQPGTAFVLTATVDRAPAALLVDTGSHRSDLLDASDPGRRLAGRTVPGKEAVYAAGGKVPTRTLGHAKLIAGEVTRTVDMDFMPGSGGDSECPRDGVIGMDVLKQCVLFLQPNHVAGRCAR